MNVSHVGILGAGELGMALGHVLEKAGATVRYYDQEDARSTTASIEELVSVSGLVLLCVPATANRAIAREVGRSVDRHNPPLVLSLSKGVEHDFITMDTVLQESLPQDTPYGLLYGPMTAEDMVAHAMCSGVMALSQPEYAAPVRELFAAARVYLELSPDMRGVALSGVLRNCYAMAFGMCDGMNLGANAKGRLAVIVLREMKRILANAGGNPETAEGLAGLGDLLSAGTGGNSFNYRLGRSIAEGIARGDVATEGLTTLKELPHAINIDEYPLIRLLEALIYHYKDPRELQRFLES